MPKVLVVDDDPVSLEIARARLEQAGHTVVAKEAACAAVLCVLAESPDVVLLDVEMPSVNGDRVVDLLVRDFDPASRPIVLLHSGREQNELDRMATTSGADGAIQKTADHQKFLMSFARAIRKPAS